MEAVEAAVRDIIDHLTRGEYEAAVEAATRGARPSAEEFERAITDYGRTLINPDDRWWTTVTVTPLAGQPGAYHLAAPLWTAEEGMSDLTLELWAWESSGGLVDVEVLDLHVL
jgi:hypothetical protein